MGANVSSRGGRPWIVVWIRFPRRWRIRAVDRRGRTSDRSQSRSDALLSKSRLQRPVLDRLRDAENAIQRASSASSTPRLLLLRYHIAFLKGDKTGMDREAALAHGKRGAEDWLLHSEGMVLARSGQLQQAKKMSRRATGLAQQAGQLERAALFEAGAAVWNAFFGNAAAARQSATDALELSNGRDVTYAAAFALALAGEDSRSHALADDLDRRFPEDTSVPIQLLADASAYSLCTNEPAGRQLLQSTGLNWPCRHRLRRIFRRCIQHMSRRSISGDTRAQAATRFRRFSVIVASCARS